MADMTIKFVNIGQGDCTLIKLPDDKILMIDCGASQGTDTPEITAAKAERDQASKERTDLLHALRQGTRGDKKAESRKVAAGQKVQATRKKLADLRKAQKGADGGGLKAEIAAIIGA